MSMMFFILTLLILPSTQTTFGIYNKLNRVIADIMTTQYYGCIIISIRPGTDDLTKPKSLQDLIQKQPSSFLTIEDELLQFLQQTQIESINLIRKPNQQVLESSIVDVFEQLKHQHRCYISLFMGTLSWVEETFEELLNSTKTAKSTIYYDAIVITNDPIQTHSSYERMQKGLFIRVNSANNGLTLYKEAYGKIKLHTIVTENTNIDIADVFKYSVPNYEGKHVTVSVLELFPYFYFTDETDTGFDGTDIRLLQTITSQLNLTFTLTSPEDGEYGRFHEGKWTGMIGMVARKEADLATGGISIGGARAAVVDFSEWYFLDGDSFVSPVPKLVPQYTSIIRPFSWVVWLLALLSLFVCGLGLHIITQVGSQFHSEADPVNSFSRSLVFALKQICGECAYRLPRYFSSRIVGGVWMTAAFILCAAYSGLLTSILVNPLREKPILTIDALIQAGKKGIVKWGKINYGGVGEKFLMESKNPNFMTIWEEMEFVQNAAECVERTADEGFACIDSRLMLQPMANRMNALSGGPYMLVAKEFIFTWRVAFPMQKGAALRHHFNILIRKVTESGIFSKWQRDLVANTDSAQGSFGETVLTIDHLTGAFYFLFLGTGLAACLFITEKGFLGIIWKS